MDEEDRYTRITLRIPKDLDRKLQESADATSKSKNAEIIGRLKTSFDVKAGDVEFHPGEVEGDALTIELDSTGYPISWDEISTLLAAIRKAGDLNIATINATVYTPELISSSLRTDKASKLARKLFMSLDPSDDKKQPPSSKN